jgi:NhaA family Na+:H+ antiporter
MNSPRRRVRFFAEWFGRVRSFASGEAMPGVLLMLAALLAMAIANSPWAASYHAFFAVPISLRIDEFIIDKPLLLWVNDGLMALFFFLVGLELKRELIEGELSDPRQALLPTAAAIGGIIAPALVYTAFNSGNEIAMRGWAIPAATDIAFALGALALLGNRVPRGLKVFLLTVAIVDDIGAILIIAVFYSTAPSALSLMVSGAALLVLIALNRARVYRVAPYILVGLVLWAAVLKSGVHATIAGVLLAMTIPLRTGVAPSPARQLEADLHVPVQFFTLPLFALANAGVSFRGMSWVDLGEPVTLGTAMGLFVGKQIGIMCVAALLILPGFARLPQGATWPSFYAVSILCGIGFTMSLFIGSLAFEGEYSGLMAVDERVGILLGSALSAVIGYCALRFALRRG